jgi:hypothetical protein
MKMPATNSRSYVKPFKVIHIFLTENHPDKKYE